MSKKKLLPPQMGWSTWNQYRQDISEALVLKNAKLMKAKGLLDAGYKYINLDDCWQKSVRGSDGRLQFDIGRFPNEERIVGQLNALGFKAGIYSSSGHLTCEDMPGSYGYEELDAQTFADWGFEYLKYDYCHVADLPTDPHYELKGFATKTPPILYLAVALEVGKEEICFLASKAKLSGPARLENEVIVDLNYPKSMATFKVDAPIAGTYMVALGYLKELSLHRQFALLSIGESKYQIWFPPSSGWSTTARVMVDVALKKGENLISLTNPIQGQKEDSIMRYARMGEALLKAGSEEKPIFYSICEHGRTAPWTWAAAFAGSWRTSSDIHASWEGVMNCYEATADLWKYQQAGAYNDPDMLEVGVGDLSDVEYLSHFVLWCMMSAPLILGMDLSTVQEKHLEIVRNPDLIALNQDKKMLQASRHKLAGNLDLLIKPLIDDQVAICFFNKSDEVIKNLEFDLQEVLKHDDRISLMLDSELKVTSLLDTEYIYDKCTLTVTNMLAHEVKLYLIS